MTKPSKLTGPSEEQRLLSQVDIKVARLQESQRNPTRHVLFGLRTMGIIGWSIALPSVVGVLVGRFLDRKFPGQHHYTLALLVCGLAIGCFIAAHWIGQEHRAIDKGKRHDRP